MEYAEIGEAKLRRGLRLVVVAGVPSPWGESAKGIFHVKQIPLVAVRMGPGDSAIHEWTGETSAPVAMYEDERPRSGWAEILHLAERLSPEPGLLPDDPAERAWLFGLAHEICGELGLGWCRRLQGVCTSFDSEGEVGYPLPVAEYLGNKYGYRPGCGPEMRRRVVELLGMLARPLHVQRAAGSSYYLGGSLTALDIYSAAFMVFFQPLGGDQCPIPDALREWLETMDEETARALDPILLEHREVIYQKHLELPIQL